MNINKIFLIFLTFNNFIHNINAKLTWTYDFTNIEFKSSDKDFVSADLEILRISRGVFAINGTIELKQPMDETFIVEVNFYRDKFCKGNYEILPYSLKNSTITVAMNLLYKKLLMENLKECATDAPYFKEFVPPLTERYVVLNKCQISEDNFPSHVSEGCYLIEIKVYGKVDVIISTYTIVEGKLGF